MLALLFVCTLLGCQTSNSSSGPRKPPTDIQKIVGMPFSKAWDVMERRGFKCENASNEIFTIRDGTNVFRYGPMNYIYCVQTYKKPLSSTTRAYAFCYDERQVVTNVLTRKKRWTLGDL